MKKIVYFLGAGASYPFGLPLTKDILPEILKSIEGNDLFCEIKRGDHSKEERKQMENDLKNFICLLMPGLDALYKQFKKDKSTNLPLITDLLSIIDHITVNNNLPFSSSALEKGKSISYYRSLLDRAIYEVLADAKTMTINQKKALSDFIRLIQRHIDKGEEITFITTNYDTAFEIDVFRKIKMVDRIDFGFSWRDIEDEEKIHYQPGKTQMRIFKLHGSLNWLKCDLCDHIYINPHGNIIHNAFRKKIDSANTCHCGNAPLKSLIVAPSFEREMRDPNLLHVWKSSVQALRQADELVMIGYSLPAEDLAIKSLLIRAKNGRRNKWEPGNFKIVQFGNASLPTYELFYGRENFEYMDKGLEDFLNNHPHLKN